MADLHGVSTDSAVLQALLDAGNRLRYGQTEGERVADVNGLRTPGVRDAAFNPAESRQAGQYNHPAAERYTSAHAFGRQFAPPKWLQALLHGVSSGSRDWMNRAHIPGVGVESSELRRAEALGMERGAAAPGAGPINALVRAAFGSLEDR